jgi:hypothetical protein
MTLQIVDTVTSNDEKAKFEQRKCNERPPTNAAHDRFFSALNRVASKKSISRNGHALLKELVQTKSNAFFEAVLSQRESGWHVDHLDEILEGKVQSELECLFGHCSYEQARSASVKERSSQSMQDNSLVYGEVELDSFVKILRSIDAGRGTFYDIGSGSGRAVFMARLMHDFDRCVGIELLESLHTLAWDVQRQYDMSVSLKLPLPQVEFHCADFRTYDWSDGDVVFCHSTCFEESLLASLFERAKHLQRGAYLITLKATGIDTGAFELIETRTCPMSWGDADVFVYRRR